MWKNVGSPPVAFKTDVEKTDEMSEISEKFAAQNESELTEFVHE